MTVRCVCSTLPEAIRVRDHQSFIESLSQLDTAPWLRLAQCSACGQMWRVDEPDKYQLQCATKIPQREAWQTFDDTAARKQLLLSSRGGSTSESCIWASCEQPRVRGVVFCLDHLYATGARE
jgi:hypothetical protein